MRRDYYYEDEMEDEYTPEDENNSEEKSTEVQEKVVRWDFGYSLYRIIRTICVAIIIIYLIKH